MNLEKIEKSEKERIEKENIEKLTRDILNYFKTYYASCENVHAWVGNMDFASSEEKFEEITMKVFSKVSEEYGSNFLVVYCELANKLCVATNREYTPNFVDTTTGSSNVITRVNASGGNTATASGTTFFFVETQDTLSNRSRVHRDAVAYFIKENIFPKSLLEDDSEEDLVFGDDELGFL